MITLSLLYLLSFVPSLLARGNGAPPEACGNLMPRHGVQSALSNDGFFLLGDVFNGPYIPGRTYEIQLVGRVTEFAGFFIQARNESNQDSVESIVGVWTPMNNEARTVQCNGVDGDAITHTSSDRKRDIMLSWTAPDADANVGRIHFLYSIVIAYTNIIVKLNATVERPSNTVDPPPEPPPDAVFFDSYGQPEGCQQDDCDVYVEWRRNGEFIDFRMEGDGSGWIALGITADNSPLNRVGHSFVDILACQADSSNMVNFKDLYLPGTGSTNPLFDSSTNGVLYTSGRLEGGRILCNFSRVQFALVGQENQDANLGEDNYIFFLSGTATGAANETTVGTPTAPVFSSRTLNLNQGYVAFTDSFTSLPGKGSYPSSSCSREDCDFYFRWGVNPNNTNYLTIFISAISQGWAAIGVSRDRRMGGDEIDDIFGCTTSANGTVVADTYNIAGGDRNNVGDNSGLAGIIPHSTGVVNGRIECTFSRIISVLSGEESSDFNLDNPYYIIIGTGEQQGAPFARHKRNPEWSTSEVNLVRETSVDFDYARVPLIKTHGIFMILAWPILAYLGISMARHMKPALPNGGWFLIHRILLVTSLFFTCLAFLLIFVAFHNNDTRGLITLGDVNRLGTAHFIIGILVLVFQFANPIIALFRCKPNSENRWIFNTFHAYIIGIGLQLLAIANVFIGLFLFGDKIANPQDMNAYWVFVALVSAFGLLDGFLNMYFGYSRYYCLEKTQAKEADQTDTEMKQIGTSDSSSPPPPGKKTPSPDHWMRWAGWITQAVIVVCLGIAIIGIVGSG